MSDAITTPRRAPVIVGIMLPDTDVDDFPFRETCPDGFVGLRGSCGSGAYDRWAMIEGRVSMSGDQIDFVMTLDQAAELSQRLQEAIADARQSEAEWPMTDYDEADA